MKYVINFIALSIYFCILIVGVGCTKTAPINVSIEGTWELKRITKNNQSENFAKPAALSFENGFFTQTEGNGDKHIGKYSLNNIDTITITSKGTTLVGIYEINGTSLNIYYSVDSPNAKPVDKHDSTILKLELER